MRAVVQRVAEASVKVDGQIVAEIGRGLLVLLGVGREDEQRDVEYLAEKVVQLRIFPDALGLMNLSVMETTSEMLVVSQFTLYGDCRRGRRPGYSAAAPPEQAESLYRGFVAALRARGASVAEGVFRAMMNVRLVNEGPVTILLDSQKVF